VDLSIFDSARPSVDLACTHRPTLRARTRTATARQRDGRRFRHPLVLGLRGRPVDPHRSGVAAVLRPGRPGLGTGDAKTFVVTGLPRHAILTDAASMDNSAVRCPSTTATPACRSRLHSPDRPLRPHRLRVRNTSWGNSLWSLGVIDSATPEPTWPSTGRRPPPPRIPTTRRARPPTAIRQPAGPPVRDHQWIQVDLEPRRASTASPSCGSRLPQDLL